MTLRSFGNLYRFLLVHIQLLQYRGDLKKSVDVIKAFCSSNVSTKVGKNGFSAADLLSALNSDMTHEGPALAPKGTISGVTNAAHSENVTPALSSSTYDFSERKNGFNSTLQYDKGASAISPGRKIEYNKEDLDFLAVAFTAVKISYLMGKIHY